MKNCDLRLCGYLLTLFAFLGADAGAVSLNFSGNFRGETAYINKPGLGSTKGTKGNKSYLSARGLLQPRLVLDDHFTIRTQWNLLSSPGLARQKDRDVDGTAGADPPGMRTPSADVPLGSGQGGYIFGDRESVAFLLSRVWLEWTSDFGVLKFGRMPVGWGHGLLYDAGERIWDDFQTTFDRVEYQLHLNYVVGGIAISKERKGSVLGGVNDADFYAAFLKYSNPETQLDAGILYERQVRNHSQRDALLNKNSPYPDQAFEIGLPPGVKTPYPLSNNVVDLYWKKSIQYFSFGGELAWLTGKAVDFDEGGADDELNALGVLLSASYQISSVKTFVEFLYASGDANLASGKLSGFVLLHRNRRPGLILGRELLGPYDGNHVALGSLVAYGNPGAYSGVYYVRPGVNVEWSQDWNSGLELIFANKAAIAAGEQRHLGFEIDLATEYSVHKNANLGLDIGFLIPGQGLRVAGPHGPFAFRARLGVTF